MIRKFLFILLLFIGNIACAETEKWYIIVHTDWCQYCPNMIEINKDKDVVDARKYYRTFYINGDKYPGWVRMFNVRGYPTAIIAEAKFKFSEDKKSIIPESTKVLFRTNSTDKNELINALKRFNPNLKEWRLVKPIKKIMQWPILKNLQRN